MGLFFPTLPNPGARERAGLSFAAVTAAHVAMIGIVATLVPTERIVTALQPLTVRMLDLMPETPPSPPPPPKAPPRPAKPLAAPLPVIAVAQPAPATASFTVAPQPPAPPAPPAIAAPPQVAPVVEAPLVAARFDADYLHNPKPVYPPASRRLGEEGKVLMRVFVGADGQAEKVELRSGSGFARLDNAAIEAVGKWRFVPARRGDQAVAAWVVVPIVFSLDS